ncbi:MAG TPA: flavin reductase [Paludibacteraceae bacterium]|nr:flavin reductase [Paludibacteraceae bacterium]
MENFKSINPKEINENAVKMIGDRWMLITAGKSDSFNTMTASWGTIGFLWGKPVVYIFIRPQRHTFGFVEKENEFTLSFFSEEYRKALNICGSTSGRDCNKVEKAGLSPIFTEKGNVSFKEANMVLECRKLYSDYIKPESFVDPSIVAQFYKANDFHKVYVAEITGVYQK